MLTVAQQDSGTPPASLHDHTLAASEQLKAAQLESALHGAAREFLSRPGKALRARLVKACFELFAEPGRSVPRAACEAVELLHSGALIVDDIEDQAPERRGAAALHVAIGVPRAVNTGNWLYFVAMARLDTLALDPDTAHELTRSIHRCMVRCHEGQALALALRVPDLAPSELAAIVRDVSARRVGTLTEFAARLGALLANASPLELEQVSAFGQRIGVALQMLDDLAAFLAEARAHEACEILQSRRVNWIWVWARELVDDATLQRWLAQLAANELGAVRAALAATVELRARACVREELAAAVRELPACCAAEPLAALHLELARMETSYA